ncbi:putative 3-hydroxyisobutyryl-CoA hydrolase [Helianthus annuus]|nr:putative 3-hydroxyisobutyryl-CoA hydrolase [Helianthus annuus]KAJ0807909.1 putative 3-hydroxyisobutyryl-CoA hydrolase [Helianthus annuus]
MKMPGSGRAFCSGGDIVSFYDMIRKGNIEECKEFFSTLYEFIYFLSTYKKPQVAVLDGVTMGGGAGVAIPETFRVATDKTVFATPETLVGLHPDAGASFHLSRLPGEFLGLTGSRLNGAEMIACGLATHYSHSHNVLAIEESLNNLITNDPCVIESCIHNFSDLNHLDKNSVFRRWTFFIFIVHFTNGMKTINKCFSLDTVEEIIEALECEAAKTHDPWCYSMLKNLKNASPLSLKVSLRSIREGRFQTLDQCLIREYRLTSRVVSCQISSDFCEGVRARLVDKDFAPKWNPPSLEHISYDMVDEYFSPLGAFESELELSTRKPELFHEQIRI